MRRLYTLEKMPITIRELLDVAGFRLTLVAGRKGLARPIRWAHTSELADPTAWLSGGELLFTTGMQVGATKSSQAAYVKRLAAAGVAGLGFGIGFEFDEVPPALVAAADRCGLPILEVPYPVPFLAIAEAISTRHQEDRLKDAQMSVEVHERLAQLVVEGSGPADVLDEVIDLTGGWALLFDRRGEVFARACAPGTVPPDPARAWASLPPGFAARTGPASTAAMGPGGTSLGLVVLAGRRSEGILLFGKAGRLEQRDRIVVHHAVTVLGLLLASRRAVIEVERRVAGDILLEAFAGRLGGDELERRLELVGFPARAPVTALVVEAQGDEGALEDLAWNIDAALGPRVGPVRTGVVAGRVAALVATQEPEAVAEWLTTELGREGPSGTGHGVRVGVGEATDSRSVRRSYLAAVMALKAAPPGRAVATPRDLGSYGFLLGAQPRPVLEGYVGSVLGPLIDRDRARSSELVASVKAFIGAGGRWEPGAEALGVHRHTLRYRVRQAEELLGRDLSAAEDRLEVWLALKAAEILEQ